MILGIMQPYFFPYIGYWQLISAVDTFVIYDDVNYIQQGWINRNKILVNGATCFFTLTLNHASSFKRINEIEILNYERCKKKLLATIQSAYGKAPYFSRIYSLIKETFNVENSNLSQLLTKQILLVSQYLDIKTKFVLSSELNKDCTLKGEEKVIDICKLMGAKCYINAIGGKTLYSKEHFEQEKIELSFLSPGEIQYIQFKKNIFIKNLSIIDVMMFNSREEIDDMLGAYTLL